MIKIVVLVITFLLIYKSFKIIDYINLKDDETIEYNKKNQIVLSLSTSILILFMYSKYGLGIYLLKYILLSIYLCITAFIDFKTQNVYSFLSQIFGAIALILMFFDKNNIGIYIVGALLTLLVSFLLSKMKLINTGDVEVYTIVALYLGGIISVFNIFFSIAISGVQAIYIIIKKGYKKDNKLALCPYIAISTFLILII